MGADEDIPNVSTVITISPRNGTNDDTSRIQTAINQLQRRPLNSNGFRGALLLEAGTYFVEGTLKITTDGVVIRGVGKGTNPNSNTIIRRTDTSNSDNVFFFSSIVVPDRTNSAGNRPAYDNLLNDSLWRGQVAGTRTNITSGFVQVGSRTFNVANASSFSVGDNIIINHPCTQRWLDAIDGGGTLRDTPWQIDEQPIVYNRIIKSINGNTITIDAPVFNHLNRSLSQSLLK